MGATPLVLDTYELRTGNALRLLREIPDESVQTCTTSPPYYSLRNYGTAPEIWGGRENCEHQWGPEIPGDSRGGSGPSSKEKRTEDDDTSYGRSAPRGRYCTLCTAWQGELGLEPTVALFIEHLVMIFREVKRVLRKDGTFFLNIADTYYAMPSQEALNNGRREPWNLKRKDLCGVPHRLVHALQDDGWIWRNDGIWSKAGGNCPRCYYRIEKGSTKPESVKDRFVRSHEYVFVLAKAKDYYFDHIAVREPHSPAARRDVFHLPNQNFRQAHYAVMPDSLAELCVRAGSPDGGCCAICAAPYKRITKDKPLSKEQKLKWGASSQGVYEGQALKDYEEHGAEDPSALKRRILERVRFVETIGWAPSCKCKDSTPVGSIVLDPFSGSGTTGAIALRHGRRYVGLELLETNNVDIADPRLRAELEARKSPEQIEFLPTESGVYHGPAEILLHRVQPGSVRLILTDPPYNVSRENNFDTMGRTGIQFEWDGNFDQETWIRLADKALMEGGSLVIFNDWKVLGLIAHLLLDLGYDVKRPVTWVKKNPWPRNVESSPVQRTEYGLWAVKRTKQSTKWVHNRRAHKSYEDLVFDYPVPTSPPGNRERHETKKPDGLFREIIQIFSNPGDLVLDPFSGGGTTAFAAEAEGRRHISFEKDEKWYRESLLHWEEGKKAHTLIFPTAPEEKARAAYRDYCALCKRLGVDPVTLQSLVSTVECSGPDIGDTKGDVSVGNPDTHQETVRAADGASVGEVS